MTDKEQQPDLPEGFQRPGIPGAGNLLDPAVRGEIREKLHGAAHGAVQQVRGEAPAEPAPPEPRPPQPVPHRAGPFPHGDVDLSGLPANVPIGPVRPNRGRGPRRFYFLPEGQPQPAESMVPSKPPSTPAGPKPG